MNSDFLLRTALLLGTAVSAMAAEVSLEGGSTLTGEVGSIDAGGIIELASPLSATPLRILSDQTVRIDFGADKGFVHASGQRLELRNGDVLPVRVESMADGLLHVGSGDLGRLTIPREMVSTIQLGIFPQRHIYSGPVDFNGWTRDKVDPTSWTIDGGEFIAKGNGTISMDAELPEKFILRFSFTWKNYPFLKFGFAEPPGAGRESVERYVFQFVGSGLGIFRESTAKDGSDPIVTLNRESEQVRDSSMDVEIRVDRSRGLLQLHIDGEMEGRYIDRVGDIPTGTGISISCRAASGGSQKIGDIRIYEWDDRADRHRTEDRGDGKSDSLIGRNGERLGGQLTGIRKEGEESVYLFKSDFQKDMLELPESEVSTVFVGGGEDSRENHDTEGFVLSLRGGGRLTVSSCVFGAEKVDANHPLLGDVQIDRAGITSLLRQNAPKAKPVKSR